MTVSFDYDGWLARYPEFSSVNEVTAAAYFTEAGIYWRNDGTGPVCDPATQSLILNMVTAHIAYLNSGVNGESPSPLVGRLSSATEGSVSVSTENSYPPGTVQWWQQSKYGAAFWVATAAFRTAHYRPGYPRVFDPQWPFIG